MSNYDTTLQRLADEDPTIRDVLTPSRTLAEIRSARSIERATEEDRVEQARDEAQAERQREAIGRFEDHMTACLTDELRHALSLRIFAVSAPYTSEQYRGEAHFTLPDQDYDGDWRIFERITYFDGLRESDWHVTSPRGFTRELPRHRHYDEQRTFQEALLDALEDEPAWWQEQQEAPATPATPAPLSNPLYACVSGDDAERPAILHTGSKLWIAVETPTTSEYGEKIETHRAQVIDWDAQWLLINLDDDETIQRLIPIARVVSIQVRA